MRALVFREPRHVRVEEVPMPEPGEGQVLVRMSGSGVCGSNLPVWEGRPWFQYPLGPGAPGHEGWGHVVSTGRNVTGFRTGDAVAVLSYHAFAEFDVAPASNVVAMPEHVARQGMPAEAVACAVNVMRRTEIRPGDRVAVVGIGFLGGLLVQLARRAGAHVTAIGRRAYSLHVAEDCGASAVVRLDDVARTVEDARRSNGGTDFDRVIEAAGTQASLDVAAALTRERGRLIIAGYHQDGPRTIDLQSWNWRGIDVINAHERDPAMYISGMREAVALVGTGALSLDLLLTHWFPLEAAAEAFAIAESRPAGFMKAMVRCDA
jgi:2-desacetyl-2-hydroxyethyl bacteriochlorophyllide A dehydrogenase